MRSKIKAVSVFLFLCLLITGCEKVDVPEKEKVIEQGKSSITVDGILSGDIVSYLGNEIDSIKAVDRFESLDIGKGEVSINGHFSITLKTPPLKKLSDGPDSKFKYSDLTASTGVLDSLFAYKNNKITGYLVRNNYSNISKDSVGMVYTYFVYCDKPFTMQGEYQILHAVNSGGYDETNKFNMTCNKGWNEVSVILINVGMNGLNHLNTYSYSNFLPVDLKWKYIKKEQKN